MNQTIYGAIRAHRLLSFRYRGQPRLVEPYIYGLTKRYEREVLSGYQVYGASRSGEPTGWKTFWLDEAADFKVEPHRTGRPRPDYNPDDPLFSEIFVKV